MKSAKELMKIVEAEIGNKENPMGSNNIKYNTEYYGQAVKGDSYPWCCVFVWWCFKHAGMSDLFYDGKKTAYCPNIQSWAKQNSLVKDKKEAKFGDVVLFDWNANNSPDHIGFIEGMTADGKFATIEGNAGDCVCRKTRKASEILMIIRPKYEEEVKEPEKPEEPYSDIEKGSWYEKAARFCVENGLMVGDGKHFRPGDCLTRAEAAQIIFNIKSKEE